MGEHNEIQYLQSENKTLKGKIRGYQRLGQLFQEVKEKNRLLEMERQNKDMVSVATETGPLGPMDFSSDALPMETSGLRVSGLHWNDISVPKKFPGEMLMTLSASEKERQTVNIIGTSMGSSIEQLNNTGTKDFKQSLSNSFSSHGKQPADLSIPIENNGTPEETNTLLRKKLEDALHLVEEFERKRSNDKKLVKILNEEVKKAKDELKMVKDKFLNLQQEKDLMMQKIAKLERERDNIPITAGAATNVASEAEGGEDWVHLHQETSGEDEELENNYQVKQLQNKCKELEEKASRWENEHFNLQMESSKHVGDLRNLLETKSKELIKVTEGLGSEKKILESKFKKLETMLRDENESKFESYNMHQETLRKYRILENKFMALEQKTQNSPMEGMGPREMYAGQMAPVSSNQEQILMLKQQVSLFKDDFENERKERLLAEKQSKTFEEKLHSVARQLEKKEQMLVKSEKSLREEAAKNEKHLQKIYKLEADNKTVLGHNHMLMNLQSKFQIPGNTPYEVKEVRPTPMAPRKENVGMYPKLWSCNKCTFFNDAQSESCKMCKAPRPAIREQSSPRSIPRWKCECCTYQNLSQSEYCSICKAPRPSANGWDEPDHKNRPLIKAQQEGVVNNDFDNDLTIDGPPSEYIPNQ